MAMRKDTAMRFYKRIVDRFENSRTKQFTKEQVVSEIKDELIDYLTGDDEIPKKGKTRVNYKEEESEEQELATA